MAIKTISQFDAATPASNDKILFEQNGEGKSTALANLPISTKTQNALDTKVNKTDSLTLKEIQETADLTGKVASASSIKNLNSNKYSFYKMTSETDFRDGEYSVGSNVINSTGYITFNIDWMKIQFRVENGTLYVRYKYGGSEASGWKLLAQ